MSDQISATVDRTEDTPFSARIGSAPGVHFSSLTNEWGTPQAFFDAQHAVHNFTLDVASTDENAKCAKHYTQAEDGLKQDWSKDRCWMNPPYGREIGIWMRKAYQESLRGARVVCLVPARTDTAWWHDYAVKGEITFLRGRLKFVGAKVNPNTHTPSAPFPSAVVVFKAQNDQAHRRAPGENVERK